MHELCKNEQKGWESGKMWKSAKNAMQMKNTMVMQKWCDAVQWAWTKVQMRMQKMKTCCTTNLARNYIWVWKILWSAVVWLTPTRKVKPHIGKTVKWHEVTNGVWGDEIVMLFWHEFFEPPSHEGSLIAVQGCLSFAIKRKGRRENLGTTVLSLPSPLSRC